MADKIINLIVIDNSFDSEEKIVSTLRTKGYTARSIRAEDEKGLTDALTEQPAGLIIYVEDATPLPLKHICDTLKKDKKTEQCRIICVNKSEQPDIVSSIQNGAADAVNLLDTEHLILVITREHQSAINAKNATETQSAFEASEKRCTALINSSRDAITYIHEGMHVYSNQSYLELFDLEVSDELEGMPILDIVAEKKRDDFKVFLRDYTKSKNNLETLETILHKPDGEDFNGEMEFSHAHFDGEPCLQIIIRKEDANLEEQLKLLSQKDQLTGLFNRQYCINNLETIISDCEQGKYEAALLEIHIDNFENIKDSVGVVGSDQYIAEAAKALNSVIRDGDILSRYTHKSFTVISKKQDAASTENYAKKLQKTVFSLSTTIADKNISTTCSIGIALIDKHSPEYNDILARSEKAVETAVANGTNQLFTYIPEKGELTRHEVDSKIKVQLTDALKNDNFIIHYQPIVSLHGDTGERYEVLVRLRNTETNKLIMPMDFLPAAERIGMAIAIDRWVLYHTIKQYTDRAKEGKSTQFFIKLSPSSLTDETLMDWLSYQIKEKQIPKHTLNFEIKEADAATNLASAKNLSHQLNKVGCGFILDDFGSGTNPFQLLEHVHTDYIRIDSNFMKELDDNPQNQETIKSIAEQAAELGKLTIAQQVPDAGSLSILWGMGFNFIQGYFLQEPTDSMEYDFTEMTG